jgi:cyclopropane fatty-acyl-phospholipid synthase-like methyltransferase
VQPADYRFPYEDDTFDAAVLISVFTHMLPRDVDRYLGEIARVLKRNGRIFATYFVITPESLRLMSSGGGSVHFRHNRGPYWIQSEKVPNSASLMTSATSARSIRATGCPTRPTSTSGHGAAGRPAAARR